MKTCIFLALFAPVLASEADPKCFKGWGSLQGVLSSTFGCEKTWVFNLGNMGLTIGVYVLLMWWASYQRRQGLASSDASSTSSDSSFSGHLFNLNRSNKLLHAWVMLMYYVQIQCLMMLVLLGLQTNDLIKETNEKNFNAWLMVLIGTVGNIRAYFLSAGAVGDAIGFLPIWSTTVLGFWRARGLEFFYSAITVVSTTLLIIIIRDHDGSTFDHPNCVWKDQLPTLKNHLVATSILWFNLSNAWHIYRTGMVPVGTAFAHPEYLYRKAKDMSGHAVSICQVEAMFTMQKRYSFLSMGLTRAQVAVLAGTFCEKSYLTFILLVHLWGQLLCMPPVQNRIWSNGRVAPAPFQYAIVAWSFGNLPVSYMVPDSVKAAYAATKCQGDAEAEAEAEAEADADADF